ncbi:hypothetical protein J5Y03_12675 [Bacillus sp. RG28]|uniref:Uncharacterized protein n=1 Tax=Gottfriedia endophytica TaxID=2820819 RepID=A0A940NW48_9BACI|nr:hypothetical protein [Gottfriedia endophytica]MBP0726028.1 hypothetical protein [Gottfriedia endophytica]
MKSTKDYIHNSLNKIKAPKSLYEFANNVPYMVEIEETKSLREQSQSMNLPEKKLTFPNFIKMASSAVAALALIVSSSLLFPITSHNGVKKEAIKEDKKVQIEASSEKQNPTVRSNEISDSTGYSLALHNSTKEKKTSPSYSQPQLKQADKDQSFSMIFRDFDGTFNNLKRDMNFTINIPDPMLLQYNLNGLFQNQGERSFIGPNVHQSIVAETKSYKPNKQTKWENGNNIVTVEEVKIKSGHTDIVLSQKDESGKESISLLNTKIALFDLKGNILSQDYKYPTLKDNGKFIVSFPEINSLPDHFILRMIKTEDSSKNIGQSINQYQFSNHDSYPIDVSGTEDQKITIQSIKETDSSVKVTFEIMGSPSTQHPFLTIQDEKGVFASLIQTKKTSNSDQKLTIEQEYKKENNFSGEIFLQLLIDKNNIINDLLQTDVSLTNN